MQIGIDVRVLMDKYYSGISEYTANLLAALLSRDHSSRYRLFYNAWHDQKERLAPWRADNVRIISSHWPNKLFNYVLQAGLSWPKLDRYLGRPDVFWSPHFNFSRFETGPSAAKVVLTVHDLSFLRYPEFFSWRKNIWHRSLGVKKMIARADMIVAVSENTKNDLLELANVSPDKIKVIYAGNNVSARPISDKAKKRLAAKFGITGPFILYVGNIEPRKNIAGLISAFNLLKDSLGTSGRDLSLVLAGGGGWKNRAIYRAWQTSPYRAQIIFTAYINQAEKEILYSLAQVFAYPSFYEGFGFPPLEAMAYGVPVLCSNVSSLPEITAEAALLINPHQEEEIAHGLKCLLTDQVLREKLSARGLERSQEFSWVKTAEQYLSLFRSLGSGH